MPVPISVVLTVYNREHYLPDAIESVLSQTHQDFEFLIWDDGSTDRSVEIAQFYAAQDKRIRLIEAAHQGFTASLKAAIAQTTGTYFGCVDSDDLLAVQALEATAAVLDTQPSVGMVYTNYLEIDEKNQILGLGRRCQIPYSKERLLTNFMTFHFRLLRRSVFEQVGGIDLSFPCAQDYDLCLRLSEVADIYHLQHPLYAYRLHAGSVSQQKRYEQITCAQRAVENALQRRDLTDRYELDVELTCRLKLREKKFVAST
ncbi:glycosyltransferase [Leptolyngbya sp. FACHB-711]|uniref:glycosyltransferase n=1 Tax=unclassified Leptolyngbya TaxID=2650499 RepID=UPI0016884FB2|nr:glycosyltransferase [Leptolyngbya sp. FACHB-711]MBD1853003.1 glycosyltransferase [Cyanobacteria bacterium FACHB-502]MBD2028316.1 glycosyltransferase [Leptolyngbya sp. FACHB-711]